MSTSQKNDMSSKLERFFKVMKVDVYFFNAFQGLILPIMSEQDKSRLEDKINIIDKKKWIIEPKNHLVGLCVKNNFKIDKSHGHLEESANVFFADLVKKKCMI